MGGRAKCRMPQASMTLTSAEGGGGEQDATAGKQQQHKAYVHGVKKSSINTFLQPGLAPPHLQTTLLPPPRISVYMHPPVSPPHPAPIASACTCPPPIPPKNGKPTTAHEP